jgi:diguanylate cyclase (GGDEF)-like protein
VTTIALPVELVHHLLVAATHDAKTGVLTSAAWHARATTALRRRPGWGLLLVDLDRFAALNAAHGHPAADQVLARVATALRAAAGPRGVVGRFGGDEFVMLVPAGDPAALRRAGERARHGVATLTVRVTGPAGPVRVTGVTASVGAALNGDGLDLTALLWSADTALYAAKHAGGDLVRLAPTSG